jgi:exodeoxyribonuclease V
MTLSAEQQGVMDQVEAFIADPDPPRPWLSIQGLAGTGKSFLLAKIAQKYRRATLCAFTGKAASVIARRTGLKASTIHSAIYAYAGEDEETGELLFDQAVEYGAWIKRLILVDESSMLNDEIAMDLLATGARVIACGDPGQLPPVKGNQFFYQADATLQEVHRQAWDSPIIRQAYNVRYNGRYVADGDAFRITPIATGDDVLAADILLCWRNETRRRLNWLKRKYLGLDGKPPQPGEPIMCLKNDHQQGVLNGAVYRLLGYEPGGAVKICNERDEIIWLEESWVEDHDRPNSYRFAIPMALAYAATCHKFQGSEADNVLLVDEFPYGRDERIPFLYTGITRAAQRVLIVQP